MKYNWQLEDWPFFSYNIAEIGKSTFEFGIKSGQMYGTLIAKQNDSQINTIIDLMVTEAIKTSQIEGEFLSRQDVMSSIKKNLGVNEEQAQQVKDH